MTSSATARRLLVIGAVLCGLAACSYSILRVTYGVRAAYVHVRWAPSVDASEREQIERRHGLTDGELREGRTWGYFLQDLSRANIRALVGDPAVEDTDRINRAAFRVWRTADRAP